MKKRNWSFAVAAMAALFLTGCGSKEYIKDINASRYVTLGNYMGIEVEQDEPEVMDGMVDMYIEYVRQQGAVATEVTGRAVQEGDTVSIDYAGYQDGEAFEGGTGSYDLTIGSGSFIDGFEEGLIGHEAGEHVTLELTFPDPYDNNPELAGAQVVFEVDINGIQQYEVPELDDAYVQTLGMEELQTVQDLKDYVYEIFYQEAVSSYKNAVMSSISDSVMANCTFQKLPEKMTERYERVLTEAGGYDTENEGEETLQADALEMAQENVMLQAIADVEGITVSDEEVEEKVSAIMTAYGMSSREEFEEYMETETFREFVLSDKVMEFLMDNASIHSKEAE